MADREYFFADEAKAKVGTPIRVTVEFSGVPKGTAGLVVRADVAARERYSLETV